MTTIATGGTVNTGVTTRTYDAAGTTGWTAGHGKEVNGVCFDSGGNVYTCGNYVTISTVRVAVRAYDGAGNLLWNGSHRTTLRAIARHPDGVVTAGASIDGANIKLFALDGTLTWARSYLGGGTIRGVAADSSGNVYVCGVRTGSITTAKYDSSGTLVWSADHGSTVYGIALDSAGNVYTGGIGNAGSSNYTTRKYDSSGSLVWSLSHYPSNPTTVWGIAADADGNVYTVGAVASSKTTQKYDTDGNAVWSANHGDVTYCVAVDSAGNVYTGGNSNGTYTTRAYDSTGTLLWSALHGLDVFGIAAYSPAPLGGVPVGLGLGLPRAGFAALPPAMALSLGLGVPVPLMPALPDVAGPVQRLYRGYVTGGDPLEIPLRWLQCRRRRGASTWLTVETTESPGLWAALSARQSAGAELVIHTGYRTVDGVENLGLFLRATLTEIDREQRLFTAVIQLTARVIPSAYTNTSRTLPSVERRGQDTQGRRTAHCAEIDPILRVGDTVNDGTATWVAGDIAYRISPTEGTMDVIEDA